MPKLNSSDNMEDIKMAVNSVEIMDLNISVRTYNCLHRAGIKTVGDLLEYSDKYGMKRVRNLGRRCFEELNEALKVYHVQVKL